MQMASELVTLDFRTRRQWRSWLEKHHAASSGAWLVFHKPHTGVPSPAYEDAVRDALCFGWIDSIIKRVDDDRYLRKFTPRNAGSKWSDVNRKRWAELEAAGELAPAGRAAAPTDERYGPKPVVTGLPDYIARAFKQNPPAWRFFEQLAPTYRRQFVLWIDTAKRPETREARIRESVSLLAAGRKLGLR
jgi:uncharacterized protein YdeI (YjbR/CyaY-like superfamily)